MTTTNSETQALDNYLHIADGSRVFVVQDDDNEVVAEKTEKYYWQPSFL